MGTFPPDERDDPLAGLRVAITGGTSGLGLALVRELHGRGARVAFVARTRDRVERVARDLAGAHGVVGDVSLKGDIHPVAVQVVGALGGLDVLVNSASDLGPTPLALLGDTDCEDLERALATNLLGPFRLTKAVLGALAAPAREGRGAVVRNVSSDAAVTAYPRWRAYARARSSPESLEAGPAARRGKQAPCLDAVSARGPERPASTTQARPRRPAVHAGSAD
jgi:NAD(P)-dependent dehydrogenase (short-subunit alcohol dehydrogenase family)